MRDWKNTYSKIKAVVSGEDNLVANMANAAAILAEEFGWWWTGFYLVDPVQNNLVLGPFQGPVACCRIAWGRGVCGTCWKEDRTLIVPDVELFPGHIACSALSRSEIVVPMHASDGSFVGVIDIDSKNLDEFDKTDAEYLEKVAALLVN